MFMCCDVLVVPRHVFVAVNGRGFVVIFRTVVVVAVVVVCSARLLGWRCVRYVPLCLVTVGTLTPRENCRW
jgi:hypothetical protein